MYRAHQYRVDEMGNYIYLYLDRNELLNNHHHLSENTYDIFDHIRLLIQKNTHTHSHYDGDEVKSYVL